MARIHHDAHTKMTSDDMTHATTQNRKGTLAERWFTFDENGKPTEMRMRFK